MDSMIYMLTRMLIARAITDEKIGHCVRMVGLAAINYPAASSGVLSFFRHAGPDPASSRDFLWIPVFVGMTDARQAAGYWTRNE
jgi:hypothetical protein